jgi:hypothetical protein
VIPPAHYYYSYIQRNIDEDDGDDKSCGDDGEEESPAGAGMNRDIPPLALLDSLLRLLLLLYSIYKELN